MKRFSVAMALIMSMFMSMVLAAGGYYSGPSIVDLDSRYVNVTGDTVSGALVSTKPCASGYTRIAANYCAKNPGTTGTELSTTCTAISAPSVDAKAVNLYLQHNLFSSNSVSERYVVTVIYLDSGCTDFVNNFRSSVREFSAVTAGTHIGQWDAPLPVVLPSTGGSIYMKKQTDAGGLSKSYYRILGYWD